MESKVSSNKDSIRLDTIMKYLEIVAIYDTWDKMSSLNNISSKTLVKFLQFGVKKGFLKAIYEPVDDGKPKKRYFIVEGEYDIEADGKEYKLSIKVTKDRGKKTIVINISRNIKIQ